jgi:hypothetical protein
MKENDIRGRAFAMPLTSPAYPPGPYRFVDREYLIITYRTDLTLGLGKSRARLLELKARCVMNAILAVLVLASVAFASNAWAQQGAVPLAPARHESPIGHRQPAASGVGRAQSVQRIGTNPELRRQDQDLDRKLSTSICRGC